MKKFIGERSCQCLYAHDIQSLIAKNSSILDASYWSKPNSTVGQIDVNEEKKLHIEFGISLATYQNSLRKLYPNQSGLKIDLIDMNGAGVCKHSPSLKMVGKFIVAVSKDNNFIVKITHPGQKGLD